MKNIILALTGSLLFTTAFAEDLKLNYPELMVTPRASERVRLEGIQERSQSGRWYKEHAAIQASALFTLLTASQLKSNLPDFDTNEWSNVSSYDSDIDKAESTIQILQLNSLVWLGLTSYMAYSYKPYIKAFRKLKRLPVEDKRQELTKERIAEEYLYKAYRTGQRMTWIYAILNSAMSLTLVDIADKAKSEEVKILLPLAALSSFLPFIFRYRSYEVYKQHEIYKKKIFGPVATPAMVADARGNLSPGINIRWDF